MPIIVNLDVVLAQRKMRLNDLAAAVDITPQNLSILKTGKARAIRFSTLEAICAHLECQPGEILEYRPETGKKKQSAKGYGVFSHKAHSRSAPVPAQNSVARTMNLENCGWRMAVAEDGHTPYFENTS